jgi:hypothetical protein
MDARVEAATARWSARPRQWFSRKDTRAVALDQSALLEILDALKAAEVDDRIRKAAQTIHQALIQAEFTHVIGAALTSGPKPALPSATAIGQGRWRPQPGDLELRIPSCALGRSSPACWSAAGGSTRPCSRGDGRVFARGQHPQGRRLGPRGGVGRPWRHRRWLTPRSACAVVHVWRGSRGLSYLRRRVTASHRKARCPGSVGAGS